MSKLRMHFVAIPYLIIGIIQNLSYTGNLELRTSYHRNESKIDLEPFWEQCFIELIMLNNMQSAVKVHLSL